MHLRKALFQAGTEIEEILERQVGMKPANDVEFRDRLGVSASGSCEGFFERHGVGAGRVLLAAKRTEAAGGDADVRGIDVAVYVEIRLVAVEALAHGIRYPADCENVARAIKSQSVVSIEPHSSHDLVMDGREARIIRLKGVGLKGMALARVRHPFDDIATPGQKCFYRSVS